MRVGNFVRRAVAAAFGLLVLTSLLSACANKHVVKVTVGAPLGFNQPVVVEDNGQIPTADPGLVCGSTTQGLGEALLAAANPATSKVTREWGDVIPGKQMYAAGKVTDLMYSTGDLLFTHPFGLDLTFDIQPDRPYARLVQQVGTGAREGAPPGRLHWEIEQGLVPHADTSTFLPGFTPQEGDRITTFGHWIIDCGHNDFHTEIHPPTLVAFSHQEGSATLAHTWYNPYYESQLFTPDPSLVDQFANASRLTDPATVNFPQYLFHQLLRLIHIGDPGTVGFLDHLEAHILELAPTTSPATWYVCAPGTRPAGGSLSVQTHLRVRPGVTIRQSTDDTSGCAGFTANIGKAYTPFALVRKDCTVAWSTLNAQIQAALNNPDIDILKSIQAKVPATFRAAVARDPAFDCYDPLVAPPPSSRQGTVTSETQPYPFYGTIEVSWKKG